MSNHHKHAGGRFWQLWEAVQYLEMRADEIVRRVGLYRGSEGTLRLVRPEAMALLLQEQRCRAEGRV